MNLLAWLPGAWRTGAWKDGAWLSAGEPVPGYAGTIIKVLAPGKRPRPRDEDEALLLLLMR